MENEREEVRGVDRGLPLWLLLGVRQVRESVRPRALSM